MGRKKKNIKSDAVILNSDIDISEYDIIRIPNPEWPSLFRLYGGGLEECIEQFEKQYGKIDGKVYYDEKKKFIGITGSNVMTQNERISRKLNEINN
jgi:hypothetical protein